MSSLLQIKGVNKSFGGLNALNDINTLLLAPMALVNRHCSIVVLVV